jgi:HD superfamily phosphodiesterase
MNNDPTFSKNFKVAYTNLHNLHPKVTEEDFRFRYLKVDWFFPNHLHNVLLQIKNIGNKYFKNTDLHVCFYAGLFHDAGLVYKRESADAVGHENRSVEYAQEELRKLGYGADFIEKVSECVRSTEAAHLPSMPEALIVRNADAYAHIVSMHFFAKANFAKDIHSFIDWFEKKIVSTYAKISIPELQEEIRPLLNFYQKMIKNYRENKIDGDLLNKITN